MDKRSIGAGKTQTAHELHRRIPDSFLYDPENVGYFLRENLPASTLTADFQDLPMWRTINQSVLSYMDKVRNLKRGERKNSCSKNQIDRCMEGLSNSVFENRINTDDLTIAAAAKTIATLSDVQLLSAKCSIVRKTWSNIKLRLRDRVRGESNDNISC